MNGGIRRALLAASDGDRLHRANHRALQWARIHPDAAHLADLISNFAEREGWESRERTAEALHALTAAVEALAHRAEAAGVPRIGPTGDVLPSWAMVAQLLRAWDSRDRLEDRRSAAARARAEAYEACDSTADGRLRSQPWPEHSHRSSEEPDGEAKRSRLPRRRGEADAR